MKQTLESAAINELFFSYACTSRNLSFAGLVYDRNAMLNMFRKGAEWHAKQSPWISVEERLPNYKEEVLVLYEYEGRIQIQQSFYLGEKDWKFGSNKILAWMPIPSFNEILEANRDVLERIKEKGD
jgi:hypothetical protein